jgi:hypothetical protein
VAEKLVFVSNERTCICINQRKADLVQIMSFGQYGKVEIVKDTDTNDAE